ncbi:MAG: dihydrodipicolinate reductase [Pseudomonadota bacterium]
MSHRVINWGTGNVGYYALRAAINHPDLELVGLHAHSEAKQGRDAGDIAGLDIETGVLATNDVDALLALKPDAVIYTANGELRPDDAVADMSRILRAGINIVGIALIYMIYPPHGKPGIREPLEAAAREGGSTLFINGIDPGFSGDVLPLAALQLADQVTEIRVQEICDYSTYEDPEFTGVAFGFGQPPEAEPLMSIPGVLADGWGSMVEMVAAALGVKLEGLQERYLREYASEDFSTPMMDIKAGTCSAVRFELEGIVNGKPLIVTEHVNRMALDQAPEWPAAPAGRRGVHRVIVTGNPSVQLECFVTGEDGDHNTGGVQATAMRVINAIPEVVAHAPGLVSTLDLPYTPSKHLITGAA